MEAQKYIYHGDKLTDPELKKKVCIAVRKSNGKCIRGRNGNFLVQFIESGRVTVVIGRLLRKVKGT